MDAHHFSPTRRRRPAGIRFRKGMAGFASKKAYRIVEAMKIRPENFRWYATFHNEGHHPHVHMVAYSVDPTEAFLTKKGIEMIESLLARDIFQSKLLEIYQEQTETRDELHQESKTKLKGAVEQIKRGSFSDSLMEALLARLTHKLRQTKGKRGYGYLPKDAKKLVDAVVDRLADDPRIAVLYVVWYERRFEVLRTYTNTMPEKVPLSHNKDFRPIRNAVVEIATKMSESGSRESDAGTLSEDGGEVRDQRRRTAHFSPPDYANTALALLCQTVRIFENRLQPDSKIHVVDCKVLQKIAEKKLAQGQKLE